jgi:hypothetical protein
MPRACTHALWQRVRLASVGRCCVYLNHHTCHHAPRLACSLPFPCIYNTPGPQNLRAWQNAAQKTYDWAQGRLWRGDTSQNSAHVAGWTWQLGGCSCGAAQPCESHALGQQHLRPSICHDHGSRGYARLPNGHDKKGSCAERRVIRTYSNAAPQVRLPSSSGGCVRNFVPCRLHHCRGGPE